MDNLNNLPTSNAPIDPEEEKVLQKYFSNPGKEVTTSPTPTSSSTTSKSSFWKIFGYTLILFMLLGNPWIDGMMCKVPYCENKAILFGIKVVIFAIGLFAISYLG